MKHFASREDLMRAARLRVMIVRPLTSTVLSFDLPVLAARVLDSRTRDRRYGRECRRVAEIFRWRSIRSRRDNMPHRSSYTGRKYVKGRREWAEVSSKRHNRILVDPPRVERNRNVPWGCHPAERLFSYRRYIFCNAAQGNSLLRQRVPLPSSFHISCYSVRRAPQNRPIFGGR